MRLTIQPTPPAELALQKVLDVGGINCSEKTPLPKIAAAYLDLLTDKNSHKSLFINIYNKTMLKTSYGISDVAYTYPLIKPKDLCTYISANPELGLQKRLEAASKAYELFKEYKDEQAIAFNATTTQLNNSQNTHLYRQMRYLTEFASNGTFNKNIPYTAALYTTIERIKKQQNSL